MLLKPADFQFPDNKYFEDFYIMAEESYNKNDAVNQIIKLYPDTKPPIDAKYFGKNLYASFF